MSMAPNTTNQPAYPMRSVWRLSIILVAILAAGWLWVSWMNGWFPFGASYDAAGNVQPMPEETLNSLTAEEVLFNASVPPESPEKEGTSSASSSVPTPADTSSILDSLTPKN